MRDPPCHRIRRRAAPVRRPVRVARHQHRDQCGPHPSPGCGRRGAEASVEFLIPRQRLENGLDRSLAFVARSRIHGRPPEGMQHKTPPARAFIARLRPAAAHRPDLVRLRLLPDRGTGDLILTVQRAVVTAPEKLHCGVRAACTGGLDVSVVIRMTVISTMIDCGRSHAETGPIARPPTVHRSSAEESSRYV